MQVNSNFLSANKLFFFFSPAASLMLWSLAYILCLLSGVGYGSMSLSFLLLWIGTVTKAAYKRKCLIGDLASSVKGLVHYHHAGECGWRQTGRHGTGAVTESLHLIHRGTGQTHLPVLPNLITNCHEPKGPFSCKPPQPASTIVFYIVLCIFVVLQSLAGLGSALISEIFWNQISDWASSTRFLLLVLSVEANLKCKVLFYFLPFFQVSR